MGLLLINKLSVIKSRRVFKFVSKRDLGYLSSIVRGVWNWHTSLYKIYELKLERRKRSIPQVWKFAGFKSIINYSAGSIQSSCIPLSSRKRRKNWQIIRFSTFLERY